MAKATAANATQEEMLKQLNDYLSCKGSAQTINCPAEMDGMPVDRCSAIEIGLSITPPGLNKSLDLKMAMKNCSSSAMCADAAEKILCGGMEAMFNATGFMKPTKCEINCCEGDLCDIDGDLSTTPAGASTPAGPSNPAGPTSAGFQPGVAAGALFAGLLAALLSRAP